MMYTSKSYSQQLGEAVGAVIDYIGSTALIIWSAIHSEPYWLAVGAAWMLSARLYHIAKYIKER